MKIFVAGGTGAIGRPLIVELLAKGHAVVALTRSSEKAYALAQQGVEPTIADIFDADAVKTVVSRAQPEVVIEQLTALPKTYTPESMAAAAPLNHRIRLEGGANALAAAEAAGVRRYLRQSVAFYAMPGPGWADEETPLAINASPAVAAGARELTEAAIVRADKRAAEHHQQQAPDAVDLAKQHLEQKLDILSVGTCALN